MTRTTNFTLLLLFLFISTILSNTIPLATSITTIVPSPANPFVPLDGSSLQSTCETGANYPVPIFLGKVTNPDKPFELLGGTGRHGHGPYDPNEDFTDTTKWSIYPQKSQNAHIAIGVMTCFTLYIWLCNVNGLLHLSKAFMLTGVVQIAQGAYLTTWVLYLLHPQNLEALWEYSLNDVMELQHLAIATCLFITGLWDFITGWVLHFQIPIYIDSYSRQIQRQHNDRAIKQPNNLLFWQRYIPIVITIGHILNGANFIKHPQHSEDNTVGHVILGVSMMLGGFCFYWVRVRHKVWRHLTQEVYPNLQNESHMTLSAVTTTPGSDNNVNNVTLNTDSNDAPSGEVWNVGARYSIQDLQALGAQHHQNDRRGKFSLSQFDVFAFDLTPPPKPQVSNQNGTDPLDIELSPESNQLPTEERYRSAAQSQGEWNGSILAVEYRKHLHPHLNAKFQWNSISTNTFINYLDNSRRYILHHVWYTKTLRELVATFFAMVATFNFAFIAWLLMTFVEPPEDVHLIHFYSCFIETKFAYFTFIVNGLLTSLAMGYLALTFLHYKGLIYFPSLYKINAFQK